MTKHSEVIEDEIEDLGAEEPADDEIVEDTPEEGTADAEGETPEGEPDAGGEISITLGDEPAPEEDDRRQAPEWVKTLREENRRKDKRIRELEQQVVKSEPTKVSALGPRPKLSDPDIDYDEDKLNARLDTWLAQKAEVDVQVAKQEQVKKDAEQKWQTRLAAVNSASKALKVEDHEEASAVFEDTFSVVQRGLILDAPEDPKVSAQLRYALGRNPKVAKELAAETNPVKFTFKLAELVTKMKVTPKRTAPAPERVVRSTVAGAATSDKTLDRLRDEAARTGDSSKVLAYRRSKKAA